jgi:hypothetical protein
MLQVIEELPLELKSTAALLCDLAVLYAAVGVISM